MASVVLAFTVSAPALAQQEHDHGSGNHEQSASDADKKPEGKRVCQTHVETGSVMPKRVCRMVTKETLAAEEREREEQLRSRNQRGGKN
jgi:hypothetical protein